MYFSAHQRLACSHSSSFLPRTEILTKWQQHENLKTMLCMRLKSVVRGGQIAQSECVVLQWAGAAHVQLMVLLFYCFYAAPLLSTFSDKRYAEQYWRGLCGHLRQLRPRRVHPGLPYLEFGVIIPRFASCDTINNVPDRKQTTDKSSQLFVASTLSHVIPLDGTGTTVNWTLPSCFMVSARIVHCLCSPHTRRTFCQVDVSELRLRARSERIPPGFVEHVASARCLVSLPRACLQADGTSSSLQGQMPNVQRFIGSAFP